LRNRDEITVFDILLEELERIIPDLNAQGKVLLDRKQYAQAHELINKAQSVVAFQGKVTALRDEWIEMQIPPRKADEVLIKQPEVVYRDNDGERTPETVFYTLILEALEEMGGRAHCQKVFKSLERMWGAHLTKKDWQTLPSRNNEIRWINTARWARQMLVNEGLLASNSPHGIWEITQAGREAVEANNS